MHPPRLALHPLQLATADFASGTCGQSLFATLSPHHRWHLWAVTYRHWPPLLAVSAGGCQLLVSTCHFLPPTPLWPPAEAPRCHSPATAIMFRWSPCLPSLQGHASFMVVPARIFLMTLLHSRLLLLHISVSW